MPLRSLPAETVATPPLSAAALQTVPPRAGTRHEPVLAAEIFVVVDVDVDVDAHQRVPRMVVVDVEDVTPSCRSAIHGRS